MPTKQIPGGDRKVKIICSPEHYSLTLMGKRLKIMESCEGESQLLVWRLLKYFWLTSLSYETSLAKYIS